MTARDYLLIYLNGRPLQICSAEAFLTLSDYLREKKGLTGTKIVCSEGDCGACTVLVGRPTDEGMRYEGIDACIVFMHQLDAAHVVTVEGLSLDGRLHPVQQALIDCFGSQCGYCTPGFVGAMVAKIESLPPEVAATDVDRAGWQQALTGNLCRCTGYVQILEAAAQAARVGAESRVESLYPSTDLMEELRTAATQTVHLCAPPRFGSQTSRELLLPSTLDEALEYKFQHPKARVVNGATDIGVQTNKGIIAPDVVLSLAKIEEHSAVESITDGVEKGEAAVKIGMRTTWAAVEEWAKESLPEFYKIIIRFGSPQIRAVGTMVGNVANGSPIGDSLPLLFVMEAELELSSTSGVRRVPVTEFFKGYKDLDLRDDELITAIRLPLPAADESLRLYKVSKRNDLDISTFTAAIRLHRTGHSIDEAWIAYGGCGPTVVRLPRTESFLGGKSFDESVLCEAGRMARGEITPISDVRGSADYRFQLAENILQKFFHDVGEAADG